MSVIRTYYDGGELKEEYYELNGKKEGDYKLYWKNGQLNLISNYVNGVQEGECKKYWRNGQLYGEMDNYTGKWTIIQNI